MVDDFGDEVHRCRYTHVLVWPDQAGFVGALVPGVRAKYVVSKSAEATALHKASGISFQEAEANCNTCRWLKRVKHPKRGGFLYGTCESPESRSDASPYHDRTEQGVLMFHPDDPMHMPCYTSRWSEK